MTAVLNKTRVGGPHWRAKRSGLSNMSRRAFVAGCVAAVATGGALAQTIQLESSKLLSSVPGASNRPMMQDRAGAVVNATLDFGANPDPSIDSTAAIRAAMSAAFGIANFVCGTGGVSSTSLVVSSVNYGVVQVGRVIPQLGCTITGPGSGGAGTYTVSPAVTVSNGTTVFSTNGQGNPFLNKELVFQSGNYQVSGPIYYLGISGGVIRGESSVQFFSTMVGNEGTTVGAIPGVTPIFMCDGTNSCTWDNISLAASGAAQVNLITSSSTSAGGTVINFSGGTTGVLTGMAAFDYTLPTNIVGSGGNVIAVSGTTVTLDSPVDTGKTVAAGDIFVFYSQKVGIYLSQKGSGIDYGVTTNCIFKNMNIATFGTGILAGAPAGNCDQCTYYNVQFQNCALAGLRTNSGNAVNHQVIGGSASGCGGASSYDPVRNPSVSGNFGAAYSSPTGSITVVMNTATTGNVWDYINGGGQGMTIIGGRSEGGGTKPLLCNFTGSTPGGGSKTLTATVTGGILAPGTQLPGALSPSGQNYITKQLTGPAGGTGTYQMTYDPGTISSTSFQATGCVVAQGASANGSWINLIGHNWGGGISIAASSYTTESFRYTDIFSGGQIIMIGVNFSPPDITASGTITPADGYICVLGNGGTFRSDGMIASGTHSNHGILSAAGNSRITLKEQYWADGIPANLWTNVTGSARVAAYDWVTPARSFANLPSPSAIFDGAELFIDDSNTAWSSANIGTTISSGGGSLTVPLRANAAHTNWVIGG